ncbi:MAG: group 1 glycosyl [Geobacteraceae bacterium]|nr:MAG: group 1 glycosyl [Geobacteraceae bacterium]
MRTVIINTFDIQGGAARAANRLHNALKSNAVESSMVVMSKKSSDPSVMEIGGYTPNEKIDYQYILRKLVQRYYIDSSRTDLSNTLFSFAYPGRDISSIPRLQSADLINLHWVGFFQTPVTIQKLMKLGKPMVWTLHDMCPFTGGCHYSAGCDGYTRDCRNCPQLSNDPYSLPNAILKDKLELFEGFPLTIASPSRWLADCARKSALFRNCRIEVIPNSIETDIYTPISKDDAKAALEIDPKNIVLMFGADSGNEKRKGFAELEAALARARTNPLFEDIVRRKGITILSLGPLTADMSKLGMDIKELGHVSDDTLIARAYSAADIFILPSLEDNLPNMMLESMACGTPVLAFRSGGIPDVVQDGVNGRLVPTGDVNALAERLVELVSDKALRERLGAESAKFVHGAYTPKIQADRYLALFEELRCSSDYKTWSAKTNSENRSDADGLDMECGPSFNAIRYKVMLAALLRAIPEICQAFASKMPDQNMEGICRLENEIDVLKNSLSWRLTAPLRKMLKAVRRES